jgi:hypothetical protein
MTYRSCLISCRASVLGATVGAMLLLCAVAPARAEERLAFHDAFALGYGFDPEVAKQYPSPLARRTGVRSSNAAPIFNFEILQDQADRQMENGSELAFGVEARYSAFTGKASASFRAVNQAAEYQFSFSMNESYDYGDYRIPNIVLTQKAARVARKGYDAFVKRYGTHCVIGEARRSYLVVHYSVRNLSSSLQSSGELHVSAEGRWTIGGFKAGADWKSILQKVARNSTVEVHITASLGNVDVTDTIQNANDIDRVLANVARISQDLNKAEGRPRGFIIEPWENLIEFTAPDRRERLDDPAWAALIEEYYKMKRTETRLRRYIDERKSYYDYLGPHYIVANGNGTFGGALGSALAPVKARIKQIEALLRDWAANRDPQHHLDTLPEFTPISIKWPRTWTWVRRADWVKHKTKGDQGLGIYVLEGFLFGGSRFFQIRARETTQGWIVDYPMDRPGEVRRDDGNGRVYINFTLGSFHSSESPLSNNNDMHGWVLEALNRHGEVVAVLDPIPNAFEVSISTAP